MKTFVKYSLITLVAVVLALLALLLFWVISPSEKRPAAQDPNAVFYNIRSRDELESAAEAWELRLEEQEEYYALIDAPVLNDVGELFYHFDSDEKTDSIKTYTILPRENLKEALEGALQALGDIYGVTIGERYFIFSGEALLAHEDSSSYEKIASGEAHVEFKLRDGDDHYWLLVTETMPDGVIFLEVMTSFHPQEYEGYTPNIAVPVETGG